MDVYQWVYSCLSMNVDMSSKFLELYTSPPRTVLPFDRSLTELQLVPAALIHVSWTKKGLEAISNLPSSSIGLYLTDSLLLKSSGKREQSTSFPTGAQLITSSNEAITKEVTMSTEKSRDEELADTDADKKDNNNDNNKKKPKWLNSLFK